MKEVYNIDNGPYGVSFDNDDNWTNDTISYADYFAGSQRYSVYTTEFSFDSYPTYNPMINANGNNIDMTQHNPFDYANNPVQPSSYQMQNSDGTLSEERTAEEQLEYDENYQLQNNYSSFNFDATSLDEIFTETGSFFRFLTASISILPSYFLTILISFFTVMLAIVIIKFVL